MIRWKLRASICSAYICATVLCSCEAPRGSAGTAAQSAEVSFVRTSLTASTPGEPRLVRIYFNPYADSIKTVLNYYVNVEGEYSDGSFLPLDSSEMILTCDQGRLAGNEWVIPKMLDFQKVTFTVMARENPRLRDTITLWLQKWKDPRDAADYKEPGSRDSD